uniref:Uncharacterized protein n=1 Tax=Anopheles atroparvus TaxID=41427 RepID=A0AAG5CRT1_ANOAO
MRFSRQGEASRAQLAALFTNPFSRACAFWHLGAGKYVDSRGARIVTFTTRAVLHFVSLWRSSLLPVGVPEAPRAATIRYWQCVRFMQRCRVRCPLPCGYHQLYK